MALSPANPGSVRDIGNSVCVSLCRVRGEEAGLWG